MSEHSPQLAKGASLDWSALDREKAVYDEIEKVFAMMDLDSNGELSRQEVELALDRMNIIDTEAAVEKMWTSMKIERDAITQREFANFVISIRKHKTNESIQSTIFSFLEPPLVKIQKTLFGIIEQLEVNENPELDIIDKAKICLKEINVLNSSDAGSLYDTSLQQEIELERQISGIPGAENVTGWITNYSTALQKLTNHQTFTEAKKRRSRSKPRSSLDACMISEQPKDSYQAIMTEVGVLAEMSHCLDKDYDIFASVQKLGRAKTFMGVGCHVIQDYNLFQELNINVDVFYNFLDQVYRTYQHDAKYHNEIHAADVTVTCHQILRTGGLVELADLDELDIAGLIISAIIHDLGHPGFTNNFLINIQDDIAVTYNDQSVLENFHIATAFKLMKKEGCSIFENLTREEFQTIRKTIINCVLSTDMARHRAKMITLKSKVEKVRADGGYTLPKDNLDEEQAFLTGLCLHSADLSNPTKPFEVYENWTYLVLDEFFNQGDVEKSKGLPVSFLCDRNKVNIAMGQVGFINGIVMPLYTLLNELLPGVDYMVENLRTNRDTWESRKDEFQEKMQETQNRSLRNALA